MLPASPAGEKRDAVDLCGSHQKSRFEYTYMYELRGFGPDPLNRRAGYRPECLLAPSLKRLVLYSASSLLSVHRATVEEWQQRIGARAKVGPEV